MKKLFFIVAISFIVLNLRAQITVSSNNYVGVGTTTPASKFQVVGGTLRSDLGTGVSGTSLSLTGEHSNFQFIHNGSTILGIMNSASQGGINFYNSDPANPTLWLDLGHKYVGIGKTDPTCALDVSGVIKMNGSAVTSDARLKDNIKDMTGALASLSNLRGVTYKLKTGLTSDSTSLKLAVRAVADSGQTQVGKTIENAFYSRNHMGFLAQDVQKVLPELVYADKDGMLSVDYISLIPILVESLKEVNQKVDVLVRENAILKKKLGL